MCEHCFNESDLMLPSGVNVCGQCFNEMYCRICWRHTNVVGATSMYNDLMMCAECVNNTPPEQNIQFDDPMDESILEPPANFDMNMASYIEDSPDYMNNLINAQVEYDGMWYFALDGQIYSVPYEIEIDDDQVRQDIRDNWDGVEWAGSIYGNYIAWY